MNLILILACVPFVLWPVLWMIEPKRSRRERPADLTREIRKRLRARRQPEPS